MELTVTSVDCGLCQSSYDYRSRKICGLHAMSAVFARADEALCGITARDFRALSMVEENHDAGRHKEKVDFVGPASRKG